MYHIIFHLIKIPHFSLHLHKFTYVCATYQILIITTVVGIYLNIVYDPIRNGLNQTLPYF